MEGRFAFDSVVWRHIVDLYVEKLFGKRGIKDMEIVITDRAVFDDACHDTLFFVIGDDAARQFESMAKVAANSEDFYERFSLEYFRDISGSTCYGACFTDKGRNTSYVFYDGSTGEYEARWLIGAIPAYFRYLFDNNPNRDLHILEEEMAAAVAIADPRKTLLFALEKVLCM